VTATQCSIQDADSIQVAAWKAPSGNVAVILTNIGETATTVNVPLDFTRLALPAGGSYAVSVNGDAGAEQSLSISGTTTITVPVQSLEVKVIVIRRDASVPTANYEGLWWAAPAGSESGWGINFAHQGDIIFATWFTYDTSGKAWRLAMTAQKISPEAYAGTLYTTTGPAFSTVPFAPMQITAVAVGSATISFSDANNATFAYTVNGIGQTKAITRQAFGPLPSCATAAEPLAASENYQDLWWSAPPGSESGWGINLTHQGDTIFATWFTYDTDRTPLWLSFTAQKSAAMTYSGTLYRTRGPAFNTLPFNPSNVTPTAVGDASFTFIDGNSARFSYTVNGTSQARPITREVFTGSGTICH
jgi:hypothetical protein